MFSQLWYKYLVRVETDAVYCDHLACCLLAELIQKNQNPVFTSYENLSNLVNHLVSEIKVSLKLLENLGVIQVQLSSRPLELLNGVVIIRLNDERIEQIGGKFPSQPRQTARDGIVYLIRAGETNLYKIGRTTDINRRLKQLQGMGAHTLQVIQLFSCHDAVAVESALHKKFRAYRVQGEWFELPNSALEFLNSFNPIAQR